MPATGGGFHPLNVGIERKAADLSGTRHHLTDRETHVRILLDVAGNDKRLASSASSALSSGSPPSPGDRVGILEPGEHLLGDASSRTVSGPDKAPGNRLLSVVGLWSAADRAGAARLVAS
jgi:hypothetical protein